MTEIDTRIGTPVRLCYPGKAIEIDSGTVMVTSAVSALDNDHIWIRDQVPSGPCSCFVVFLGERFRVDATAISSISGSALLLDSGFEALNARSAPRIAVAMVGTYYLRPPTLGVPVQIVDLSITGLAMLPVEGEVASVGQRRMMAFEIDGRLVKTVVEFVSIDAHLWRARFIKLALSDEDAIARLVMDRQVDRRRALSDLEIRTPSTLDAAARWRYPLVEEVSVERGQVRLTVRGVTVVLEAPAPLDEDRGKLGALVGELRLGDLRDVSHYLSSLQLRESSVDVLMLACMVINTQLWGESLAEMISVFADEQSRWKAPSTIEARSCTPGAASFADDLGRHWSLVAHSTGVGVYRHSRMSEASPEEGWVDPVTLAKTVLSCDDDILVAPWYDRWTCEGVVMEFAFAVAGLHPRGLVLATFDSTR